MNAIILAAGNSSRMYQTGAATHKALLPILGVPNIERTILMLHCFGIIEIYIIVPYNCNAFEYLKKRYSCHIIYVDQKNRNTLQSINYVANYINDSYIIEGDVVFAKNVFNVFENSTYYVMNYPTPEIDDWHPIVNQDCDISSFKIGCENSPAIFGVSFWASKDCPYLISHLKQKAKLPNANDPNIFWDNSITEILSYIHVKTYKISIKSACEMNIYTEYQFAQEICNNAITESSYFFDNVIFMSNINNTVYEVFLSTDKATNIQWLMKLFNYYGEDLLIEGNNISEELFSPKESVYIIKDKFSIDIAFFSIVQHPKYILLRRLYIAPNYRHLHIGSQIVRYVYLYSKCSSKELRVNVYDKYAEKFYKNMGFKEKFKTYSLEL